MTATLESIRNTFRRGGAVYTAAQYTDAQIDDDINFAYRFYLPEHMRNLKLKVPYVFTTTPNVDTYNFPYQNGLTIAGVPQTAYVTVEPPAYCQGYNLRYFQSKDIFYNTWPKLTQLYQVETGDGTVGPYTGTVPFTPFLRAQKDIFGNVIESAALFTAQQSGLVYVAQDSPVDGIDVGDLIGPDIAAGSFVNYITGQFSIEYNNPLPAGVPINAQVVPYQPSRPVDMLFFNNQFVLRPVPMDVYQVEIQAYRMPTAMIANGDLPELNEWADFLAYLALKRRYAKFPDPEGQKIIQGYIDETLLLIQRRTLKQINTQRANTIFSTPTRPNVAGYFYGSPYGG